MSLALDCRFNGRNINLLHRHHRLEGTPGDIAARGHRIGQDAWGNLPVEAPFVLAPAARTFSATIADDSAPVTVRFRLIFGRDLKREGFRLSINRLKPNETYPLLLAHVSSPKVLLVLNAQRVTVTVSFIRSWL